MLIGFDQFPLSCFLTYFISQFLFQLHLPSKKMQAKRAHVC